MKIIAFLVVAIGFAAVTEAASANYGAACSEKDKCVAEKNMVCKDSLCRCTKDTSNFGKWTPNTAKPEEGCDEKCEGDFKCGANAECKSKYCVCTGGFVYDDTYKPADGTKGNFACKLPSGAAKCGDTSADFKIAKTKCACVKPEKKLIYQVGTGKYKCEAAGSNAITPLVIGLIVMMTLVKCL